jgi:hypothetical protein
MRQIFTKGRCVALVVLLLLGAAGGAAWVFRTELLCWYYLRGLAAAGKNDRDGWIEQLAALDTAAVPGLLNQLGGANAQACANAEAALSYLANTWGRIDARTLDLARQLNERFTAFSPAGQEAAVEWHLAQLTKSDGAPPELTATATQLLAAALPATDRGLRAHTLALANVLLEHAPTGCLDSCRELVRRELRAPEADCRTLALHLLLHPDLQRETVLLRQALPLLKDNDAAVRRAAVLAVGAARAVITEDDLLPVLHDSDKEVRRLAELALKQRGLSASQILLGTLITDPRPQVRLQIVCELPYITDLDPGPWLQRLSRDPAPAVRAAAARAMERYPIAGLRPHLQQMAQNDPSDTTRQIAGYYCKGDE